jgi:formylglycine-generating enzyme required for sulfatase activity
MNVIIPPVCAVSAGPFPMGSDRSRDSMAEDAELPSHIVQLPVFQITQFPVTVAEYACAVYAGAVSLPVESNGITWERQLATPDHPVRCVLWQDAQAYAHWLTKVSGIAWRLPSEAEWEKAARGTDGRIFPWGDEWDQRKANTSGSGYKYTTPVGSFVGDESPYGVRDMAGNVFEWCSSIFASYPYEPTFERENLGEKTNKRVIRGGTWGLRETYARSAARTYFITIDLVLSLVGFRLASSDLS